MSMARREDRALRGIAPRARQLGRIRLGEVRQGRPARLDRWRLTSPFEDLLHACAATYGGAVRPWKSPAGPAFELYTEADALEVILPPDEMDFSQAFEMWSGGGCQRRCDGFDCVLPDGTIEPCACPADGAERASLAKSGAACQVVTRLSVILPACGQLGVWRLDTHGYYAATEMAGDLGILRASTRGLVAGVTLRIEQRMIRRSGQTMRFPVPVLQLPNALASQLLAGASETTALPEPTETRALPAPADRDLPPADGGSQADEGTRAARKPVQRRAARPHPAGDTSAPPTSAPPPARPAKRAARPTAPSGADAPMSEAQNRHLHALAAELGMSHNALRVWVSESVRPIESMTELDGHGAHLAIERLLEAKAAREQFGERIRALQTEAGREPTPLADLVKMTDPQRTDLLWAAERWVAEAQEGAGDGGGEPAPTAADDPGPPSPADELALARARAAVQEAGNKRFAGQLVIRSFIESWCRNRGTTYDDLDVAALEELTAAIKGGNA